MFSAPSNPPKTRQPRARYMRFLMTIVGLYTVMGWIPPVFADSPCGRHIIYCELVEHEVLPGDLLDQEKSLTRIAAIYGQMSDSPITPDSLRKWNNLDQAGMKEGMKLTIFYAPKGRQPKRIKKRTRKRSKRQERAKDVERARSDFSINPIPGRKGLVEPYPLNWIIRGFGKCVKGKRQHPAIDIAGVGPKYGLGTPVRAMVRSRVEAIHVPEDNPARYGTRDTRDGVIRRFGTALPRHMEIPEYGKVRFFTRDLGSARTGVMLVTRGEGGGLKNHVIRYMHLGAIHPKLKIGSILKPGDEIGVMGSTAILESVPHVHIDITDPRSKRVDVAELLGFKMHVEPCGRRK